MSKTLVSLKLKAREVATLELAPINSLRVGIYFFTLCFVVTWPYIHSAIRRKQTRRAVHISNNFALITKNLANENSANRKYLTLQKLIKKKRRRKFGSRIIKLLKLVLDRMSERPRTGLIKSLRKTQSVRTMEIRPRRTHRRQTNVRPTKNNGRHRPSLCTS